MKNFIFFVLLALYSFSGFSQGTERLKVGVFWDMRPQSVIMTIDQGNYLVYGDGERITNFTMRDIFHVALSKGKIKLSTLKNTIGSYSKLEFIEQDSASSFNIKPNRPKLRNRAYEDNLIITPYKGRLKIINDVEFSNYLAGVVQSESGNGNTEEYYKVQAIICRTYALKHISKFKKLGFNLCDRVDSQVYKHKCLNNDTIRWAVNKTKDIVLVDSDINLISAVFHSNSGGHTLNSEDVWTNPLPYLRAVEDTFSHNQPHFAWEISYSKKQYLNYFRKHYGVNTNHKKTRKRLLRYCPENRDLHLHIAKKKIPLTNMRRDFKLRSTFFCVEEQQDSVKISGRGFGHGVGLSQEGAMKMAERGIPYTDILHFYYKDVHLVKLSLMDLFSE